MVNSDLVVRATFEQVGCVQFCEKIQTHGHHAQLANMFAQGFKDEKVKLGDFEFVVTEETISQATGIPLQGESWFKGKELDVAHFKEFVKPQFKNRLQEFTG